MKQFHYILNPADYEVTLPPPPPTSFLAAICRPSKVSIVMATEYFYCFLMAIRGHFAFSSSVFNINSSYQEAGSNSDTISIDVIVFWMFVFLLLNLVRLWLMCVFLQILSGSHLTLSKYVICRILFNEGQVVT